MDDCILGPVNTYRRVYELAHGKIGQGRHIHHTCLNHWCINPAHLKALTPGEHRHVHLKDHYSYRPRRPIPKPDMPTLQVLAQALDWAGLPHTIPKV